MLLPETAGASAQPVAEQLQRELSDTAATKPWGELHFTTSIGVTECRPKWEALDRALPRAEGVATPDKITGRILTARELQGLERENIIRALEESGWRVSGDKRAAELLGMNPSTLSSRMKALEIKRPRQD